jgi:hypothetical protein
MTNEDKNKMDWGESIANIIVYVLVDSVIVKKEDSEEDVKRTQLLSCLRLLFILEGRVIGFRSRYLNRYTANVKRI